MKRLLVGIWLAGCASHSPPVSPTASPTPVQEELPISRSEADSPQHQRLASVAWRGPRQDYRQIDHYALSAQPDQEKSLDDLATYLASGCHNDQEKSRAIFRWMADRISYNDSDRDNSAEAVLKERRTLCDGYANLFVSLGGRMNLECSKIKGYATARGFSSLDGYHAWVRVQLDGSWALIDPTWSRTGGGGFTDKYFLLSPDQFVRDHWPIDSQWQLLTPALSREAFDRLVGGGNRKNPLRLPKITVQSGRKP